MNKFKDLIVWQKSINMVTKVHALATSFPKEEIYGLTSQIRRSAISNLSNIAEGAGRGSKKDFSLCLDIAKGSSFELETQLLIATNLKYLAKNNLDSLSIELDEIQKMKTGLQKSMTNY